MRKVKKILKQEKLVVFLSIIVLSLVVIGGCFLFKPDDTKKKPTLIENTQEKSLKIEESTVKEETSSKIYVDIKGAVVKPGMYEVTPEMRILNVVELAGGLLKEADDKQVNFAQRLEDQMVIYIPKEGEILAEIENIVPQNKEGEKGDEGKKEGKINLNQATKEELMTLNGVGEKKAEKIIEHREEKGSFESIEDLKKVNGFGEKTFESLKESITI
ncbi:helix-hairpin-helix domain-containing protein [Vagococcus hydrophili]|uniref:ComEA protein n=1 Tax=Vagococcus hydrophili TaxID=2714947 RepID=A0A6G8AX67_9ENTE|nr:helix-hairpin-helix domain-containing protein [Vagococcus hydrophili]QIL49545.1 comEA protein [Vagococcus hydrophili]